MRKLQIRNEIAKTNRSISIHNESKRINSPLKKNKSFTNPISKLG